MIFEAQIVQALKEIRGIVDDQTAKIDQLTALFHSDYATVDEVATMKGVSPQAIRKKIANGEIDPMNDIRKNGRQTYIRRTAIPKIKVRKSA